MHRLPSALALMIVVAGCGQRATPRSPSSTCVPEGTWAIASDDGVHKVEVTVKVGMVETLEPSSEGPGRIEALLVQVDRERCRIHVVQIDNIRYSDDAGDTHQRLTLDIELEGDRGRVAGRYHYFDNSESPDVTEIDEPVTGSATRVQRPAS